MKTGNRPPLLKRIFDVLVSALVLILAAPFTLLVLVLIKTTQIVSLRPLDPLFYSETRFSNGKPFTMYKFNIFKYDIIQRDQEAGLFIHTKSYEKNGGVTWIGWVLKQIYMDELPQFFNVLRGDMSIVGPRPVNQEVYEQLLAAGVDDKSKINAGITGPFQSQKNIPNRGSATLDKEYVEFSLNNPGHKIVFHDIKIILKTIVVVFKAQGI